MKCILTIGLAASLIACSQNQPKADYLGVVNIEITGDEAALPLFEKGLLLLHSFEYKDAKEAFVEAQTADSTMAMAYWGEAMTYNHSLWNDQKYDEARAALATIEDGDLDANITELEKDFIESAQILYRAEMPKHERDVAYAEFMQSLTEKYPDNHEVSAFYALSLLGSVAEGRVDSIYGKGAEVAKSVLAKNPNHPGALHYLIHSYDDPEHAELALDAAYSYAKVAPDASHALHMPSHIFLAMGMWDEVISSNIDSYQASVNRMERKDLGNDARGYHAFHWLQYGYLQKGNSNEPQQMLLDMAKYTSETPSKRARVHMVLLKGTYLVATEEWDSELANLPIDVADLNLTLRSMNLFIEGMKAYDAGDEMALDSIIQRLNADRETEAFVVSNSEFKICAGVSRDESDKTDLINAEIRQCQLQGLLEVLRKNPALAEAQFLNSIELGQSVSYSFGPPSIQKPSHELYADWLLEQGRNEAAAEHYQLTLEHAPKRLLSEKGLKEAKEIS